MGSWLSSLYTLLSKLHANIVIGVNIAYYRNLYHMSQEQLGDKVNIEQSHVSKIEWAAVEISLDMLCTIAKALEIEPYLLLKPKE